MVIFISIENFAGRPSIAPWFEKWKSIICFGL